MLEEINIPVANRGAGRECRLGSGKLCSLALKLDVLLVSKTLSKSLGKATTTRSTLHLKSGIKASIHLYRGGTISSA